MWGIVARQMISGDMHFERGHSMKAIVFLCLVVLVGFVLLGRMSGDLEGLREQKSQLETELRVANEALGKSQANETAQKQSLAKLQDEHDRAVGTIQALKQTVLTALQERDKAVVTAQGLKSELSTALRERDQYLATIQKLRVTLSTVLSERLQAVVKVDSLTSVVRELQSDLQNSQVNTTCDILKINPPMQADSLGPIFTLLAFTILAGYSGIRRMRILKLGRRQGLPPAASDWSTEAVVSVQVPRVWMTEYARWLRQMQSVTRNPHTKIGSRKMK
jgi:hypothetical protein